VLEQDVRLLADGTPVVMHDEAVERLTQGRGLVRTFDAASWAQLRIDTRRWPAFHGMSIAPPLFADVLSEFAGRVVFVPEAKDVGSGAPMVAALEAAGVEKRHALVQSFLLPELAPPIAAGYPAIFLTRTSADIAAVRDAGVAWVGIGCNASDAVFTDWIAAGFKAIAWTVDDRRVRDHLRALGVSGFFSDDPLSLMA
jgi:glycerophosphoryl diester phosphodiesterase